MKITFWTIVFFAGLFIMGSSCKQNASSTEVATTADSAFVPHPMEVPKQDVKALGDRANGS